MKVLIVDDDIPTTQAIKDSVNWGIIHIKDVFVANNIIKAKRLIVDYKPEIIICDIEMPKGTGLDLIKWVRANSIFCRFLFLTCHEEFIYASEAIKYGADAYITKPCEMKKIQAEVANVVEKITYQRELELYSEFGEKWVNNTLRREKGFWRDLLLNALGSEKRTIESELENRDIKIDPKSRFKIVLGSVRESVLEKDGWDAITFRFALSNISSEILTERVDAVSTIDYYIAGRFLVCIVLKQTNDNTDIESKCDRLIEMCKLYLRCDITCYIGAETTLDNIAQTRLALEEADAVNTKKRSKTVKVYSKAIDDDNLSYSFNSSEVEKLLGESRSAKAVNKLRSELEYLENEGKLNRIIMRSIQHDYMQIIYSILYNNDVQAHKLFSDEPSKKLFQLSDSSVFEMMKWASYVTSKTFQYIKESREADTIVDKMKRFMTKNYGKKLSRDIIAAEVFLSPDYVSKIFFNETNVHIKDYLNELRISNAKKMLFEGKLNISEISTSVGFDNFSYFSTLFKKSVGVSPSEYKKTLE